MVLFKLRGDEKRDRLTMSTIDQNENEMFQSPAVVVEVGRRFASLRVEGGRAARVEPPRVCG